MAIRPVQTGRSLTALLAISAVALGLTGCSPGRSVEAYCGVISEHKDRYLTAMEEVNSTENLLTGVTGFVSALGDLSQMWEEAAKVAPEDIQTDVEAVRDAWNEQFEAAEKMADNPLGGLASGIMNALTNAPAIERIDQYTKENCPGVGGMFVAQTPTESTPSPTPDALDTVIQLEERVWLPFGPFLKQFEMYNGDNDPARYVSSTGLLYLPGIGETTVDAAALLPSEEVVYQQYGYGYDGDEPFIIGLVGVRIPASGLTPEQTVYSVLRIEPTADLEVTARVEIDFGPADPDAISEPSPPYLSGSSRTGIVTLNGSSDCCSPWRTIAIDLVSESIAWDSPTPVWQAGFGLAQAVLTNYILTDSDCVVSGVNFANGEELWRSGNCDGPRPSTITGGRYVVSDVIDPEEGLLGVAEVRAVATGKTVTIPMREVQGVDPLSSLGWGRTDSDISASNGDLVVVDLDSGQTVFTIEQDRYEDLELTPVSIFDKHLYVTTTDEQLVVDLTTGEEAGTWTEAPLAEAGDYTWMTDDGLRLDWKPDE